MKVQTFFLKPLIMVLLLAGIICLDRHVDAADVENCNMCHKYSGLGRIDESGKKRLFYVNEESYTHSVHGRVRCKECHVNIDKFPHVDLEKVNCATECHLVEPSTERKFSHARMIEKYEQSVHGKCLEESHGKNHEDLPTCTYCHQNRILEPITSMEGEHSGIAQEILERCLGCHDDERWTKTYYSHLTHRLKKRRTSKRMVALCTGCHEDAERMKRHGLEATGTFRDTFHWQAIKFGDENAPNCIDCHAPVGYFAHSIMPRTDPRSAIHKDNLVQTCSNINGLQQCHPGATAAFSQGKIHPSGVKARLFDRKLASFEKKEMIKKGEHKPFQSLLAEKAQDEFTSTEYYQSLILQIIKYFYKFLIGGLISFMILHQILDYFATRREMKRGGHR